MKWRGEKVGRVQGKNERNSFFRALASSTFEDRELEMMNDPRQPSDQAGKSNSWWLNSIRCIDNSDTVHSFYHGIC